MPSFRARRREQAACAVARAACEAISGCLAHARALHSPKITSLPQPLYGARRNAHQHDQLHHILFSSAAIRCVVPCPSMSEKLEAALIGLLNEHPSLGNGKARELLGLDEAAYESLKAELLTKGLIATGRGRGGSIRLADKPMKSRKAAEPQVGQQLGRAPCRERV